MQITLYHTSSDKKVVNKALAGATVKNVTLKDGLDQNAPVFYIQNDVNLMIYNYCYIPDWGYYYIVNHGVANGQQNIIYCEFDPRKTMIAEIYSASGRVTRSLNGNNYIPDGKAMPTKNTTLIELPFNDIDGGSNTRQFLVTLGCKVT